MSSKVSIVTDPIFLEHRTPAGHPESPRRLENLLKLFEKGGPFADLRLEPPAPCSLKDLEAIHDPAHLQAMEVTAGHEHLQLDPDTHTSPKSFEAALKAAGAAMKAVDLVMTGEVDYAFSLARPPGHHAERKKAMGFCLFNNAAQAAAHARKAHQLERVLVLDWDVHHGNGTQDIFYQDPAVLYVSSHQFPFYPGTGNFQETGEGEGKGYTVNIPMSGGMSDADFQELFERVVQPVVMNYKPQLLIVSAGYDAYFDDPVGGQSMTENGFARLTRLMMDYAEEVCQSRLAFVLEGGYNIDGLRSCVAATLATLVGRDPGRRIGEAPSPLCEEIIANVRRFHGERWKI